MFLNGFLIFANFSLVFLIDMILTEKCESEKLPNAAQLRPSIKVDFLKFTDDIALD